MLGSLVGGTASISTALFTQRALSQRESTNAVTRRRELVYTAFIDECSKLALDAVDNTLDKPATLMQAYALMSRIRLTASDAVVVAAENTLQLILAQYFQPPLTVADLMATKRRAARRPAAGVQRGLPGGTAAPAAGGLTALQRNAAAAAAQRHQRGGGLPFGRL